MCVRQPKELEQQHPSQKFFLAEFDSHTLAVTMMKVLQRDFGLQFADACVMTLCSYQNATVDDIENIEDRWRQLMAIVKIENTTVNLDIKERMQQHTKMTEWLTTMGPACFPAGLEQTWPQIRYIFEEHEKGAAAT